MPSKNRRLPGGKVRRPSSRARPAPPSTTARPPGFSAEAPEAPPPVPFDETSRVLPPAAPGVGAPPRRRGAVTARTLAERAPRRSGPTSLDLAETGLTYIRTDLTRILILAAVMVGVIIVLAFVLR